MGIGGTMGWGVGGPTSGLFGRRLNEGQLFILSSTQLEACAPDPLVRDSPLLSQDGVFWQK